MANWAGIKAAAATKFLVSGVNSSTSTDLEGLGELPAVKVLGIESMDIDASFGDQEFTTTDINCVLLIQRPGPITDAIALSDSIIEALRVAARTDLDLGYTSVVKHSYIPSFKVHDLEYAGETVFGAEFTFRVETWETVSRTV